ncbi:MAG: phenylalanine--tRNA ligase beta subunit-related protein, partial [Angustibacter sp.]
MDLSLKYMRTVAPWMPDDAGVLRNLFDMSGIEVKHLDFDGQVVSVELLANRGDHRSIEGVVRELAAHLRPAGLTPVSALPLDLAQDSDWPDSGQSVHVEPGLADVFELLEVALPANTSGGALGPTLAHLLEAAGLAADALLAVAATNLVNLEIGQPLHAYDADLIAGRIDVRESRAGEQVRLLGQSSPTELPPGTLVIADQEKVLSVAGVMGGADSAVTETTSRILIESASFDPTRVRRAAQALRITSHASQRFERGGDPLSVRRGLKRVLAILEQSADVKLLGIRQATLPAVCGRTIALTAADTERLIGVPVSESQLAQSLAWFGYSTQPGGFAVPGWRFYDVFEPADLIEDVAQAMNYNIIGEKTPANLVGKYPSPREQVVMDIQSTLLSHGYFEVIGDAFVDENVLGRLQGRQLEPAARRGALLRLRNSVDPRNGMLRRSTIPTALEVIDQNVRDGIFEGSIFEWSRVYAPADGAWPVDETSVLWFARFSREAKGADAFGAVRAVLEDAA